MADSEDTTGLSLSRRSLLGGGGGVLVAGAAPVEADRDAGALYREWVRAVAESDALAAEAARMERRGDPPAAVERAWARSDAADAACDRATARLLAARPETPGGLADKAECVRWRMEVPADAELVGGLVADLRRMAAG